MVVKFQRLAPPFKDSLKAGHDPLELPDLGQRDARLSVRRLRRLLRSGHVALEGRQLHRSVGVGRKRGAHRLQRSRERLLEVHDRVGASLLDLSGSMESGGLVQRVAKAALGAYQSLVACQVPVSVYGHTALVRGGSYVPLVYAIAGYQMPLVRKSPTITKAPARGFSLATVVEHSQNFDGIAIDCVSKRFSEKPGTKILVVLSDGQPYGGSDYGGQRALEHTAEVIRRLNHSKISVLSLSLTDEVMEANDKLYGKGNLPAYGSLLDKSLRHLVQVIATGQPLT